MPILHRDIKSENILLTEGLEPRIADLGEARAMAKDAAMTIVSFPCLIRTRSRRGDSFMFLGSLQVGTNGYTAPEVLKGEHYGTPADVFSFAIVMSELLMMQAPYSDLMKSADGGENLMSWDQVVAMTHQEGVDLRPTLATDLDAETSDLIRHSWARDPARRPSFPVLLIRLQGIKHRMSKTLENSQTTERLEFRALARNFHDLVWLYNSVDYSRILAGCDFVDDSFACTFFLGYEWSTRLRTARLTDTLVASRDS